MLMFLIKCVNLQSIVHLLRREVYSNGQKLTKTKLYKFSPDVRCKNVTY